MSIKMITLMMFFAFTFIFFSCNTATESVTTTTTTTIDIYYSAFIPPEGYWDFLSESTNDVDQKLKDVWNLSKEFNCVKELMKQDNYSYLNFLQPYALGMFDPKTAEWITIVVADNSTDTNKVNSVIVIYDYLTFNHKITINNEFVKKDVTIDTFVDYINANPQDPYQNTIDKNNKSLLYLDHFYIFTHPVGDFGGIFVMYDKIDELLLSASTIWAGSGSMIIPVR